MPERLGLSPSCYRVVASSTCRQVHGEELLPAEHGHGTGGEAPEDVHVCSHVEEREVTECGEKHRRAQRLCRRTTNNQSGTITESQLHPPTPTSSECEHVNAADSLEAGLEVKYLIMKRCREGTLQQQNTMALAAMIPGKKNKPAINRPGP